MTCAICNAQNLLESKAELYTGPEFKQAFKNPQDNPKLPNVLLIGDSISIGYTIDVRKQLHGKADVFRIPTNGRYASYGTENLEKWLSGRKYDVIHFNWGLWDLCYRNPKSKTQGNRDKKDGKITATPDQYRKHLDANVEILKQNGAKLIWCETTPVPEKEEGRHQGDAIKYNKVASEIMVKNDIQINDLHAHASKRTPKIFIREGNVHFTNEGSAYLAEKVATEILKALSEKK